MECCCCCSVRLAEYFDLTYDVDDDDMIEYDAQHSKLLASCDHRKETLFAFQFYSFWFSLSPCLILDGSQSTVQSLSLYRFSFFATCVVVRLDSRSSVGRAVYYYYYYSVHRKRQPFPMSKHMSIPGNHLHTIDGVFFFGRIVPSRNCSPENQESGR